MKIARSAAATGQWNAKIAQIGHRLRWAGQRIFTPKVGVVGGYHLGNVGDMAMGYSVLRRVTARGLSCGLQTIYNLERWPKVECVIVGGGAVGYGDSFRRLSATYNPGQVVILGVDFNEPSAVLAHAKFLNQVALITCRSARQAANLREVLGRTDIIWHPDLCFSLYDEAHESQTETSEPDRVFGVNCVPLFLKEFRGRFLPGTDYLDELRREEPHLIPHIDKLGMLYCNLVRAICHNAKRAGMRVIHIPFTPLDDVFAQTILNDLGVEFVPYTSNVMCVLSQVGQCKRFFTSRFHSLVFSILKYCHITPFCYAPKCNRLLSDLHISDPSVICLEDLILHKNGLIEQIIEGDGIHVPVDTVRVARDEVRARIDSAIDKLAPSNCV
jgi:hypothetical protein